MSSLLCLIAHPDDEIFCAGLLAQLSSLDISVYLGCLTRGEGGTLARVANDYASSSSLSKASSLAQVRQRELLCSVQALGLRAVSFMEYVDRPPTPDSLHPPQHDPSVLRSDIRALVDHYQPSAVLTHGSNGDYGHPAHTLLHRMTRAAVEEMSDSAPALYSFNAFHPTLPFQSTLNPDDWATFILDVSPFRDAKRDSLACHESQWPVFVDRQPSPRAYQDALSEYVDRRLLESYCWHGSCTPLDKEPLADWLGVRRRDGIGERLWRSSYSALRTLKNRARQYFPAS
jgi:LmbE family N-acetylglucosaminyl deacetylase